MYSSIHELSGENLVRTYQHMRLARECDEYELMLIRHGVMRFHIGGSGSETSALLGLFLNPGDQCHLHWRDRALRMSRGVRLNQIAATFFGLPGNEGGNRNLSCHESSRDHSVFPIATPTASQCLPACGAAMALKDKSPTNITICSVGDGSTRQGEFLEAIAFSIEYSLPIVWLIVDNGYAISTKTNGSTAMDLKIVPADLCSELDGHNIDDAVVHFKQVVAQVREHSRPRIIRMRVPRLYGHTSHDDHRIYRTQAEIESEKSRDPLPRFRQWLATTQEVLETELLEIEETSASDVKRAYEAARSQWTNQDGMITRTFRELGRNSSPSGERISDAVRDALDAILSVDRNSMILGEDIADPFGGVFRLTKGLSNKYPGRVINSPLAEATIIGVACGRATSGLRTIAEIQFMDFLAPGWNQLTTNVASQMWRTDSSWDLPLILYTVAGAYTPGSGMFHSQVNASLLVQNRDLVVAYPSSPEDVRRVFANASVSNHPTFVLLPKARLWDRQNQSIAQAKGFSAMIRRRGTQATVVTWGNGVAVCERALEQLEGAAVELIDLCYLSPLDVQSVHESVQRTGRLLVVDEDVPECSVGSDVISRVVTDPTSWSSLKKSPILLARKSQYVPTNESEELAMLPFPSDVVDAVRALLKD